jgi:hypothetical protein
MGVGSKMLEIYTPGSIVFFSGGELASGGLRCRVITVSITGHEGHCTVRYEVSWIVDSERKTAWIESFEIVSSPRGKSQVGFIVS